jgi:hypothetical protein
LNSLPLGCIPLNSCTAGVEHAAVDRSRLAAQKRNAWRDISRISSCRPPLVHAADAPSPAFISKRPLVAAVPDNSLKPIPEKGIAAERCIFCGLLERFWERQSISLRCFYKRALTKLWSAAFGGLWPLFAALAREALAARPTKGESMMVNRLMCAAACVAAAVSLSACGESKLDRGLSGGAMGAGAGAVGGALLGHPAAGAALGGAAGAATGALTSPDDINLGKPVWR